jgi:hypothetical protein
MHLGMYATNHVALTQEISLVQALAQCFGETSGDIPVYSLHRIARLMAKRPIDISAQMETILKRQLITANKTYKAESGNDWNCLTSGNLVSAIEGVDRQVKEITTGANAIPHEFAPHSAAIRKLFNGQRAQCIAAIKQWFETNYDDLLYKMDGKIPWAVIQRLRKNLGMWIAGAANPFRQSIDEMVFEVAESQGIYAQTAEDAWELLGGTLFNK